MPNEPIRRGGKAPVYHRPSPPTTFVAFRPPEGCGELVVGTRKWVMGWLKNGFFCLWRNTVYIKIDDVTIWCVLRRALHPAKFVTFRPRRRIRGGLGAEASWRPCTAVTAFHWISSGARPGPALTNGDLDPSEGRFSKSSGRSNALIPKIIMYTIEKCALFVTMEKPRSTLNLNFQENSIRRDCVKGSKAKGDTG